MWKTYSEWRIIALLLHIYFLSAFFLAAAVDLLPPRGKPHTNTHPCDTLTQTLSLSHTPLGKALGSRL